jgi:D-glycero-alpha-D-manno-heptose-7-phosphate kinase
MIISQTPLRISFVGGGTDMPSYYENTPGMVISTTIDKYLFVIINERFDDKIYINYMKKEIVNNVNEIEHELVREAMKMTGVLKGVEITMLADIPSTGSGLGSSSTLTVGLLNALYNYLGKQVTAEKLASEACQIEIDILKKPIGKQDQYIAAYGGVNKFIFKDDGTVESIPLNLSRDNRIKLGSNILLHFTNITRKADTILSDQKNNTQDNLALLNSLVDLVGELEYEFSIDNWDALGLLLKQNWDIKKHLARGITMPEIDEMVEIALNNGAIGVKIAGAGGGGFLLSYVPRNEQDNFRKAMNNYMELPFMLEPFGSRIVYNMRRYNAR